MKNLYWILYHIASGHAFFTGLTMVALSVVASNRSSWFLRRLTILLLLIGLVLIVINAAPQPVWMYVFLMVSILFWGISYFKTAWKTLAGWLTIASCLMLQAAELPFHINPSIQPRTVNSITVIGDSVTAGLGSGDPSETWPRLLAAEHDLVVKDISHVGETAASALKRVGQHSIESNLFIIEIGGNDVLGSTSPEKFENDLNALIGELADPDRLLLMFELPLPPFYTAFGKHQRHIAAKHHVKLIPKRHFYSLIGRQENTVDGVHLSQEGHDQMADTVWQIIGNAVRR